jgi:hypothetical protein
MDKHRKTKDVTTDADIDVALERANSTTMTYLPEQCGMSHSLRSSSSV